MFCFFGVDDIKVNGRNLSTYNICEHVDIELGTVEEYAEFIRDNYKRAKDDGLVPNGKLFGTEHLCLGVTSQYDLFKIGTISPLIAIYHIDSLEDINLINSLVIQTNIEDAGDNILTTDYIGKEVVLYVDYYDGMFTRLYGTLEEIINTLYKEYDNEYDASINREKLEKKCNDVCEELTIGTFKDVLYKLEDVEYSVVNIKSYVDMLAVNLQLSLSSPVYSNICQRFVDEKNIGENVLIYDGQCYGNINDYIEGLKTRYNNGKDRKFALDSSVFHDIWNLVVGIFDSDILIVKPKSNDDITSINKLIGFLHGDELFTDGDIDNEVLIYSCEDIVFRIGTLNEIIDRIISSYHQIVGGLTNGND